MSYLFYIDGVMLPVTPGALTVGIGNKNQSINLIDNGEINVLRQPGLSTVEFEALLPNVQYPFSQYDSGFEVAGKFLEKLEELKISAKPFRFIVTREKPFGGRLFSSNFNVSLESYTIKENAKDGQDVIVSVKLKQYKDYGTKVCTVTFVDDSIDAQMECDRDSCSSPCQSCSSTYTVVTGDCLWNIAKYFYGDGSKYTIIYNANTDKIGNPNLIYPGQVLVIPAG